MSAQTVEQQPRQEPAKTPAGIRAALLPELREQFEADYQQAMAAAAESFDLTAVYDCLDRWYAPARLSFHDPEGHRKALAAAKRIEAGEAVTGSTWAEIAERHGLPDLPH